MNSKKVLITRADKEPLGSLLEAQGYTTVFLPLTRFAVIDQAYAALKQRLLSQQTYSFVLITSPKTAELLGKLLTELVEQAELSKEALQTFFSNPFAVVGPKISNILQTLSEKLLQQRELPTFLFQEEGADFSAARLEANLQLFLMYKKAFPQTCLWLSPQGAMIDFKKSFPSLAIEAHFLYQSVPHPNQQKLPRLLAEEDLRWISFTSPKAVEVFYNGLEAGLKTPVSLPKTTTKIVSIGQTTHQALANYGIPADAKALFPSMEELVKAMLDYDQLHP